jgi:hypothetical protein
MAQSERAVYLCYEERQVIGLALEQFRREQDAIVVEYDSIGGLDDRQAEARYMAWLRSEAASEAASKIRKSL